MEGFNAKKAYDNKKDGSSSNSGANKNLADQLKLASIVEESEHDLTPPRLSRMTDTSIAFTDWSLKNCDNEEQKGINSSQSDISISSDCVSTEEEVRVVTGCSSSEDDDTNDEDSYLSENNENESFDSECSDMSSNSPDPLAETLAEKRVLSEKDETIPIFLSFLLLNILQFEYIIP